MPQEMLTSARIAKALREFRAKYGDYVDVLPEMALSQASSAVAVPAGLAGFLGEDSQNWGDKGDAFKAAYDRYAIEPKIAPSVTDAVAGVIPDAVKGGMRDYDEWASLPENNVKSMVPEMVLSGLQQSLKIPKALQWEQLKGHEKEGEIREKGVWPTGVGGQYVTWDPRNVDRETGIPHSFSISNNPNSLTRNSARDGTTTASVYGEGNHYGLPPFAKVGSAFNATDGSGAGAGGDRYNVLIDAMFGNKMGATSSNQNSAFSTASWERELHKQQARRDNAVGIMAKSHPAQSFVWDRGMDRPTFSGTYMTNSVPNWGLFPREVADQINSRRYSRATGTPRGPNGEQPNFAVMYSQSDADGKVLKERVGNKTRVPPVYLTADDAAREGVGRAGHSFSPMSNEERRAQVLALRNNRTPPEAPVYDFPYAGNPADYTISPSRVPDDPTARPDFGNLFETPAPQISARRQEAAALREAAPAPSADRATTGRQALETHMGRLMTPTEVRAVMDTSERTGLSVQAVLRNLLNAKQQSQSRADLPVMEVETPSDADLAYIRNNAAAIPEVQIPAGPSAAELRAADAARLQEVNRQNLATATALRNRARANRDEIQRLEGLDVRNEGWDAFRNMKRDSLVRTGAPQIGQTLQDVTNRLLPRAMMEARPTNPLMREENQALVGEGRGVWDREYVRALRPSANHDAASIAADAAKSAFYGMERRPDLRDAFLEQILLTPRYDRP